MEDGDHVWVLVEGGDGEGAHWCDGGAPGDGGEEGAPGCDGGEDGVVMREGVSG